jgi:propane monooxygenase reductase subunit
LTSRVMGEEKKHKVYFEPVDIEIEASEEETVLDAAFRQGVMLMHGCKEGQCAACKAFLLDGDMDMDPFSTFALNEFEEEEGFVLLCRSHAYSDLEVELIGYHEDMLQTGIPLQRITAEVEEIEDLTHDMKRLVLNLVDPPEMQFLSGQYAELYIPGTQEHRAYSMANTPTDDSRAEFIIRVYPGGRFSEDLLDKKLEVGDSITLSVPYGVFTLREKSEGDLIFVGGGSGMAPILSILRHMAESGIERNATFYYGARTKKDLFYLDEIRELGEQLPGEFKFVPVLSEPEEDDEWDGETGMVTDAINDLEDDLSEMEAYMAGPPPMIDAAIPVLTNLGLEEEHIYYDKFTQTSKMEEGEEQGEEVAGQGVESGPEFPGKAEA